MPCASRVTYKRFKSSTGSLISLPAAYKNILEERRAMKNIDWGRHSYRPSQSQREAMRQREAIYQSQYHTFCFAAPMLCALCSLVDILSAHTSPIFSHAAPSPTATPFVFSCDYVKMDCRFLSMYSSGILRLTKTHGPRPSNQLVLQACKSHKTNAHPPLHRFMMTPDRTPSTAQIPSLFLPPLMAQVPLLVPM